MKASDGNFLGRIQVDKTAIEIAPLLQNNHLYVLSKGGRIAIYKLGPKLLARIEGEGKLIEDITDRRRGLNLEVFELTHSGSDAFRRIVSDRVLPSVVTLAFLMRQYLKREPLAGLCAGMVESHAEEISRLPAEEQANMRRVIGDLVTVRRLDAEYVLHRLLGKWLPAHVGFTAAMWFLILAHIAIVVFF